MLPDSPRAIGKSRQLYSALCGSRDPRKAYPAKCDFWTQLLRQTIFPQLPPKVEYYLTDLGRSLLLVIDAMKQWCNDHRRELERIFATAPATPPEATD